MFVLTVQFEIQIFVNISVISYMEWYNTVIQNIWSYWDSNSFNGQKKFKKTLQQRGPLARQSWLIDFASFFKDARPILTSPSLQPWLVQRNKSVDTLFQQMRNDKCINHSSSAALRFQLATVPGWMATPLMTTSQEASTEAWWHCAKTDSVFIQAWTHSSFCVCCLTETAESQIEFNYFTM